MSSTPNFTVQLLGNIAGDPAIMPKGGVRFTVSAYDSKAKAAAYVTCFGSEHLTWLKAGMAVMVQGQMVLEVEGKKANIGMYNGAPNLTLSYCNVSLLPKSFTPAEPPPSMDAGEDMDMPF